MWMVIRASHPMKNQRAMQGPREYMYIYADGHTSLTPNEESKGNVRASSIYKYIYIYMDGHTSLTPNEESKGNVRASSMYIYIYMWMVIRASHPMKNQRAM